MDGNQDPCTLVCSPMPAGAGKRADAERLLSRQSSHGRGSGRHRAVPPGGSFLVVAFVRAEREEALQRVPALAASLSASVDRKLSSYIGNLNALSSAFQASGDSVERFTSVAKAGARALGGSVVLLDRAGQQRINTASASTSTLPQTADLSGLKRVFEAGKPDIGDLVHGTIHSRMIFSARIPILIDGSIRYSLEYVPSAKDLVATVEEMALPRGWFAAVLDRQGNIVARSYRHEDFYGMSAGNAFLSRLTVPAGLLDSVDLEGRKTVTAYQRSAFSPPLPHGPPPLRSQKVSTAALGRL